METLYLWQHTDPRTGRRRRTRHRLSEADARRCLIDPQRIEGTAMDVQPVATTPAGHWRSGLERREDGAMVPAVEGCALRAPAPGE